MIIFPYQFLILCLCLIDENGHVIDYFILGFRAISPDGNVYIGNEEEIEQKKYIISKSKNLVLITTPEKLNASGLFRVSSLKEEIEKKNKKVYATSMNFLISASSSSTRVIASFA